MTFLTESKIKFTEEQMKSFDVVYDTLLSVSNLADYESYIGQDANILLLMLNNFVCRYVDEEQREKHSWD